MTGFGRGAFVGNDFAVTVELKTVNNRFLDVNLRLSQELSQLEATIKRQIGNRLSRGRVDVNLVYERAAEYVAKIMLGTKPSELPVEEPTRFVLTISRTTAKAIGLPIPPSLLLRVDEVME